MIKINKQDFCSFLKNTLIYGAIIIGGYLLYGYNNKNTYNIPHTDFSFIYAQF